MQTKWQPSASVLEGERKSIGEMERSREGVRELEHDRVPAGRDVGRKEGEEINAVL